MGFLLKNVPEGSHLLRQSDDLASNEFKNFTKLVDPWQKTFAPKEANTKIIHPFEVQFG